MSRHTDGMLTDIGHSIDALEEDYRNLEKENGKLQETIDELEEKITTLEERLADV
jgi:peptidoglycan hydrolase CwlO-like protein